MWDGDEAEAQDLLSAAAAKVMYLRVSISILRQQQPSIFFNPLDLITWLRRSNNNEEELEAGTYCMLK